MLIGQAGGYFVEKVTTSWGNKTYVKIQLWKDQTVTYYRGESQQLAPPKMLHESADRFDVKHYVPMYGSEALATVFVDQLQAMVDRAAKKPREG